MRLRSQSLHERCMAHPALIPAVAFAIGIAIARYMPMPIWGIIIPAVATVVFAALGRTLPSLAIGLAMTGYICGDSALPDPLPPSLDGTKVNIIGEVLKAEPGTDRTRYVIEVSQCTETKDTKTKNNAKTKAKAKAKTGAENIETSMPSKASADRKSDTKRKIYAEKFRTMLYDNGIYTYRPGDIVSATGILRDARAKDIVPDAADYNRYLYLQGVNSVLWLTKEEMYPISKASDNTLSNILDKARAATTNAIIDSGAGSDTSAFLTAVIVGDDSYLQPDTDEAFRTSGLAHLLALSGLHVGIIIMFITVCLSWMRPSRYGYRIFYILIIAASFAYAAFAGMTPSVVRAACMVAVLCVSAIFQRRANVYNSLCVAIFLWLVINPLWLFAPGFQMSVCAVLGITIALRAVNAYRIRRTWVKKALRIVIVPMAAMAATAIPAMAYFHTFPLYFLPANILASIAIVPMMFCGVLLAIATMTGIGHGALAYACDRLYAFIEFSAKTFGGDSGVVHTYPSMLTIFCCLAAVAAFFFFLYRPRSIMRISMLCCACIFVII
ncbi:MAG TPA: ComEC/Rec2 family competence protein [Muribaculaceae bacterium]|nr:ComEC/Rec2 family competence protein [Muribaculaceae bacterium]